MDPFLERNSFPIEDVPFEEICLRIPQLKQLEYFVQIGRAIGDPDELKEFVSVGLIETVTEMPTSSSIHYYLAVSEKGKRYLQYRKEQKRHWKRDNWQFWITTLIAAAALIRSYWGEICWVVEHLCKLFHS